MYVAVYAIRPSSHYLESFVVVIGVFFFVPLSGHTCLRMGFSFFLFFEWEKLTLFSHVLLLIHGGNSLYGLWLLILYYMSSSQLSQSSDSFFLLILSIHLTSLLSFFLFLIELPLHVSHTFLSFSFSLFLSL